MSHHSLAMFSLACMPLPPPCSPHLGGSKVEPFSVTEYHMCMHDHNNYSIVTPSHLGSGMSVPALSPCSDGSRLVEVEPPA